MSWGADLRDAPRRYRLLGLPSRNVELLHRASNSLRSRGFDTVRAVLVPLHEDIDARTDRSTRSGLAVASSPSVACLLGTGQSLTVQRERVLLTRKDLAEHTVLGRDHTVVSPGHIRENSDVGTSVEHPSHFGARGRMEREPGSAPRRESRDEGKNHEVAEHIASQEEVVIDRFWDNYSTINPTLSIVKGRPR